MSPRTKKRAKAGYMISAVAELYKLHPQTLRLYERVGLLKPSRSQGNTRLYTDSDLERLDVILTLARDMGVNLAGIEIILNMREKMIEMERQMGINSAYAALFEPGVRHLNLAHLPGSHTEGPDYLNVLKVWDIPQMLEAVRQKAELIVR